MNMKRVLTLILALLTVLSVASCAAAPMEADDGTADVADENEAVIAGDELTDLAEFASASSRVLASEDTYVRGGSYANQNFYETKKDSGTMEIKRDTGDFRRDVLVKFNLEGLNLSGMRTVSLYVSITSNGGGSAVAGEEIGIYAYKIPSDWSSKTVTYNSAHEVEEDSPDGTGIMLATGSCQIDVTDAVFTAVENGEKEISFRLIMTARTRSQAYMASTHTDNVNSRPKLLARNSVPTQNYEERLLAGKGANDALWEYAQQMYDEWYVRYQEILAKGDYDYESVVTDPSQYNTKVYARKGNGGKDVIMQQTRLVSDLEGYEAYVYDVDDYGGAAPIEKQEATGYYYTTKINDRWWLVDPEGNLVHIHGTTHFKYGYGTSENSYSVYQTATAQKRFGSLEKWAIAATRWAKNDLGFNATYAVASITRKVELPMPNLYGPGSMTAYANSIGAMNAGSGIPSFVGGAMPVFNPGFETYMNEKAKAAAEYTADKPHIIGYITDNEIVVSDRMLASYLSLDYSVETSLYSYVCAWTWYKNMTGEDNPSALDIDEYSAELGFDLYDLFKGFIYDRYFKVCATALKTYDPNRLYFGQRFLIDCSKWEWMTRVAGYWCDVMCINYYHVWEIPTTREAKNGYPTLDQLGAWLGKPFIVTEFYSKGDDAVDTNGNPFTNNDGAGWVVATQTERGYFYQNYTLKLLQCKYNVGWMQFQFIDNDPTTEGGESSNKGIVDSENNFYAYSDFTEQLAMINKNSYALIEYFDNYDYFQ